MRMRNSLTLFETVLSKKTMYTRDSFQFFSAKELSIHTQRALNVQPAHQTCRAKDKHRLMLQQIKVYMQAFRRASNKKKPQPWPRSSGAPVQMQPVVIANLMPKVASGQQINKDIQDFGRALSLLLRWKRHRHNLNPRFCQLSTAYFPSRVFVFRPHGNFCEGDLL